MKVINQKLSKFKWESVNFITGAVVLTFELTDVRLTAPYIGTTIYVWTSIIGVILTALTLGYALGGKIADKRHNPNDVVLLLALAALSILLMTVISDFLLSRVSQMHLDARVQALLVSLSLYGLPTFLLGTISPYLVRLNISQLATRGKEAGSISAAGTAGSLMGTFITGYSLFGYMGTHTILALLALVLLTATLLISTIHHLFLRLAVLCFCGLVLVQPTHLQILGFYKNIPTPYTQAVIKNSSIDNRPVRVLKTNGPGWQSGIFIDHPEKLAFTYIQDFASLGNLRKQSDRYLIIGGGAYTLPGYLAAHHPYSQVDTVEIDKELELISRQYFGLKPYPNLKTYNSDGRQFLNTSTLKYNHIFVDAFTGIEPPFQLLTKEAAATMHSRLQTNGLIAMNILAPLNPTGTFYINSIAKTYLSSFKNVKVLEVEKPVADQKYDNFILLASDDDLKAAISTIGSFNGESEIILNTHSAMLFTDNYAPVERLVSAGGQL